MAFSKKKKLQYESELRLLKDIIYEDYEESEAIVFRNLLTVPSSVKDITPQSKRHTDDTEPLLIELTKEDVSEMSLKEKKEFISDRTLSVYNTLLNCKKDTAFWTKRILEKTSEEAAEIYLKEKRGPYIAEIQLNNEIGLIEKRYNKKGHANILLYEDADLDAQILKVYGPFDINDLLKDNEEE